MNVTGIIAEYNPLHCGHRYHMALSRKETGADYLIVVMSGDYVQRGEPAVLDRQLRTRMALLSGADLVLELPYPFSCSSAEDFAASGTALLDRLGVVNVLSFGSESGNLDSLSETARLLSGETEEFRQELRRSLEEGLSFPAARQKALELSSGNGREALLLSSPNDILGVEYLRALNRIHSSIRPHTVSRAGDGYHEPSVTAGSFASATAIRRLLKAKDLSSLKQQVAPETFPLFLNGDFLFPEGCSPLLNYAILAAGPGGYERFRGFSRELAGRLAAQAADGGSWQERILRLKTRNYTYTRVSRALLNLMLNLSAGEADTWKAACGPAPFARILGFRRSAAPLLSAIKKRSSIPVIAKAADAEKLLSPEALAMFQKGVLASQIRTSIAADKYKTAPVNEYRRQIEIL